MSLLKPGSRISPVGNPMPYSYNQYSSLQRARAKRLPPGPPLPVPDQSLLPAGHEQYLQPVLPYKPGPELPDVSTPTSTALHTDPDQASHSAAEESGFATVEELISVGKVL